MGRLDCDCPSISNLHANDHSPSEVAMWLNLTDKRGSVSTPLSTHGYSVMHRDCWMSGVVMMEASVRDTDW